MKTSRLARSGLVTTEANVAAVTVATTAEVDVEVEETSVEEMTTTVTGEHVVTKIERMDSATTRDVIEETVMIGTSDLVVASEESLSRRMTEAFQLSSLARTQTEMLLRKMPLLRLGLQLSRRTARRMDQKTPAARSASEQMTQKLLRRSQPPRRLMSSRKLRHF